MFRLETKVVIIILFILTLTVPIYFVFNYSTETRALRLSNEELGRELEILQSRINTLDLEISKKVIKLTNSKRDILSPPAEDTNSIETKHPRDINIFIETNQQEAKQFYKTFGFLSTHDLFKYVKKLPEDKRKRILITGGAGFVG